MNPNSIYDRVYTGAKICTMQDGGYNIIEKGAIAVREGRIEFIGAMDELPEGADMSGQVDVDGALITPAFIDCHTHLVYGGNRACEFEQRLTGVSYEEIARQGGGIMSTVNATRAASADELYESARERLEILQRNGVVAFEIKSGYGLDLKTEEKMLRVIQRLKRETGLTIKSTFLGAHALPPEYVGRADEYIEHVCRDMMPHLAKEGLIDAVDIFVENIAFTAAHAERVFKEAKSHDLDVKIHAEQLSNMGGTKMAAQYEALSSDHIEYLDEAGVGAMGVAGMVGVLLPGAFYTLKETQKPPIELMRKANVPMALATDHNPGSSPAMSLLLMLNMGCTLFGLTPEEALAGITINAAKALKLEGSYGSLEQGKKAHFLIWKDMQDPAELSYYFGYTPEFELIYDGEPQT
jgi:imidazolonepropionase